MLSITATRTSIVYRDTTSFITAVAGTLTITSTYRSVTIVTISSADVATSFLTVSTLILARNKLLLERHDPRSRALDTDRSMVDQDEPILRIFKLQ